MLALVLCSGCAAVRRPPQPLATSLQDIVPHADGDHFVYVWHQVVEGGAVRAGIQVEHLSARDNGEFDVTLSEDGTVIGHTRFRDDGQALLLVSETLGRALRLSYEPPLPQIATPLYAGETRASATVSVHALRDGVPLDRVNVSQVMHASRAPAVHTALGDYREAVQLHTVRTLLFPNGPVELRSTSVLVPGIGEVRSEGTATGAPTLRRELACATIGSRAIGNCRTLRQRVEALERAGSTDVQ